MLIIIRHLVFSSKFVIKKNVLIKKANIIPKATNSKGITPKTPFLLTYFGDIYLTYIGTKIR